MNCRTSPIVILAILIGTASARGVSPGVAKLVDQANAAYAAGDYEAALDAYALAEVDCPQCAELAYNQGLAYYRIGDYPEARSRFNEALATRDLGLEARCKFNLGNVAYAQALERLAALPEAIESARQAIQHYRDALDLNPGDEDARANIEIAQLLIKDLLDKQKKQQEEQQQDQDQQQKDDMPNLDDQPPDKPQDQNAQSPQDDPQNQQQDQQQQQQESQQSEQNDPNQKQQTAQEMTAEEADRILQAVRDKEAKRRQERARQLRGRRAPVSRDW